MDKNNYLEERLNNQIEWYDTKSEYHQHRFKILKYTEVSMGFLIPLISIAKPINFEFFFCCLRRSYATLRKFYINLKTPRQLD